MARGKRWSESENKALKELVEQGLSLGSIVETGKLEGRTPRAIEKQAKTLKECLVPPKKTAKVALIGKAAIPDFEEIIARYVDAFNRVCEKTEFTKEELERFRLIFQAAWKYRDMFREYQEIDEVKADVDRLKQVVAQLLAEKKTEA